MADYQFFSFPCLSRLCRLPAGSLCPYEALLESVADEFGTGAQAELGHDAAAVVAHGQLAEVDLGGDLIVAQAATEQEQQVLLAGREDLVERRWVAAQCRPGRLV